MISPVLQIGRLWRTVRHLKWRQLVGRIIFWLARPKLDKAAALPLRSLQNEWLAPARRRSSIEGPDAFHFLGEAGSLDEYGWDDPRQSKLWRYNQHYFDDLNAKGADDRRVWHVELLKRWIAENPPTSGTGWEPYPTSLRIVNWVKFALGGHQLSSSARHCLALQARWLSKRLEWHLLGNHLFANAKALIFAGLFYRGEEADDWLASGIEILREQLPEQILSDGSQFELSPMYHALALEDMLDLVNVARAYGEEALSSELSAYIPAMLAWLALMTHPDGEIAFFNDAAFGIAPDDSELREYAKRLGFAAKAPAVPLLHSQSSGYVRLERGGAVLIADIASIGPDYLPGHAHADTLSFELSLFGHRLIVNGGTSIYGTGEERLRQRGTAAHSTLVVDGENSSEVWSGFRVGRRARPADVAAWEENGNLAAKGQHDGYNHLPGRPVHRRVWTLTDAGLRIDDMVEGGAKHSLEAYFHLHPQFVVKLDKDTGTILITRSGREHYTARFTAMGGDIEVIESSWHPEFGVSIPTNAIRVSARCSLPHTFRHEFDWGLA
ncbi:heparinase [Qipengyuania flava]|uniref:Heparinase n=2 Tax=Qipengyuania flava TaxID=192812 RepID=A0A5P6NFN7_9SPHN|nr:heparinase [Qipengyuania flava]